jgi:phosphoglycolate phosphatase-like HAD superfamily hydrolase
MIRVVLFDIDGTLVHTGGAGTKAFSQTFRHVFGLKDGVERMKFAGRTDVSLVREFLQIHRLPASPENFRRFFDNYVFWLEHIVAQSHGGECRGITPFLRGLLALPQPPLLGLLTGNIRLGAEIKLRRFGLWNFFVMGGFADDSEDRDQIAVAALARARRVLDVDLDPQEAVVVGDTPFDVRCGKFIGAKTLAVATGGSSYADLLRQGADWTVEDVTRIDVREICPR